MREDRRGMNGNVILEVMEKFSEEREKLSWDRMVYTFSASALSIISISDP